MLEEEATPVAESASDEPFIATQFIDLLNLALAPLLETVLLHGLHYSSEQEFVSSSAHLLGGPCVELEAFEGSSFEGFSAHLGATLLQEEHLARGLRLPLL